MNQIQTPIQQIDIKAEHQQKQTIQVVQRPPLQQQNANQQFIAQSLPPSNNNNNNNNSNLNVNISINSANVNIDQMTSSGGGGAGPGPGASATAIDDNLSSTGSNAQSYNQKTYERMRQDEGKFSPLARPFKCNLLMAMIFLHSTRSFGNHISRFIC